MEVSREYDRYRAFGNYTKPMSEFARERNIDTGSNDYSEGLRDGTWTKLSHQLDEGLKPIGEPIGEVTGAIGSIFGPKGEEAGRAVGESLPRMAGEIALSAIPGVGIPLMATAMGMHTYADTGSYGAAAVSGGVGAAMPFAGRIAGNAAASAFGVGERVAGTYTAESMAAQYLAANAARVARGAAPLTTGLKETVSRVAPIAGKELGYKGAQFLGHEASNFGLMQGQGIAQHNILGEEAPYEVFSPEYLAQQIPWTIMGALGIRGKAPMDSTKLRTQLEPKGAVTPPAPRPVTRTDAQKVATAALITNYMASGDKSAAATKAIIDAITNPDVAFDSAAELARLTEDATPVVGDDPTAIKGKVSGTAGPPVAETTFTLRGRAEKTSNGKYKMEIANDSADPFWQTEFGKTVEAHKNVFVLEKDLVDNGDGTFTANVPERALRTGVTHPIKAAKVVDPRPDLPVIDEATRAQQNAEAAAKVQAERDEMTADGLNVDDVAGFAHSTRYIWQDNLALNFASDKLKQELFAHVKDGFPDATPEEHLNLAALGQKTTPAEGTKAYADLQAFKAGLGEETTTVVEPVVGETPVVEEGVTPVDYQYASPESKAWWEKKDELQSKYDALKNDPSTEGSPELAAARKALKDHEDLAYTLEGRDAGLSKRRIDKSNPLNQVNATVNQYDSLGQQNLTGFRFNGDWTTSEDGRLFRKVVSSDGKTHLVVWKDSLKPLEEAALDKNTKQPTKADTTPAGTGGTVMTMAPVKGADPTSVLQENGAPLILNHHSKDASFKLENFDVAKTTYGADFGPGIYLDPGYGWAEVAGETRNEKNERTGDVPVFTQQTAIRAGVKVFDQIAAHDPKYAKEVAAADVVIDREADGSISQVYVKNPKDLVAVRQTKPVESVKRNNSVVEPTDTKASLTEKIYINDLVGDDATMFHAALAEFDFTPEEQDALKAMKTKAGAPSALLMAESLTTLAEVAELKQKIAKVIEAKEKATAKRKPSTAKQMLADLLDTDADKLKTVSDVTKVVQLTKALAQARTITDVGAQTILLREALKTVAPRFPKPDKGQNALNNKIKHYTALLNNPAFKGSPELLIFIRGLKQQREGELQSSNAKSQEAKVAKRLAERTAVRATELPVLQERLARSRQKDFEGKPMTDPELETLGAHLLDIVTEDANVSKKDEGTKSREAGRVIQTLQKHMERGADRPNISGVVLRGLAVWDRTTGLTRLDKILYKLIPKDVDVNTIKDYGKGKAGTLEETEAFVAKQENPDDWKIETRTLKGGKESFRAYRIVEKESLDAPVRGSKPASKDIGAAESGVDLSEGGTLGESMRSGLGQEAPFAKEDGVFSVAEESVASVEEQYAKRELELTEEMAGIAEGVEALDRLSPEERAELLPGMSPDAYTFAKAALAQLQATSETVTDLAKNVAPLVGEGQDATNLIRLVGLARDINYNGIENAKVYSAQILNLQMRDPVLRAEMGLDSGRVQDVLQWIGAQSDEVYSWFAREFTKLPFELRNLKLRFDGEGFKPGEMFYDREFGVMNVGIEPTRQNLKGWMHDFTHETTHHMERTLSSQPSPEAIRYRQQKELLLNAVLESPLVPAPVRDAVKAMRAQNWYNRLGGTPNELKDIFYTAYTEYVAKTYPETKDQSWLSNLTGKKENAKASAVKNNWELAYALLSPFEFSAEAFSNPRLKQLLAAVKITDPKTLAQLRGLKDAVILTQKDLDVSKNNPVLGLIQGGIRQDKGRAGLGWGVSGTLTMLGGRPVDGLPMRETEFVSRSGISNTLMPWFKSIYPDAFMAGDKVDASKLIKSLQDDPPVTFIDSSPSPLISYLSFEYEALPSNIKDAVTLYNDSGEERYLQAVGYEAVHEDTDFYADVYSAPVFIGVRKINAFSPRFSYNKIYAVSDKPQNGLELAVILKPMAGADIYSDSHHDVPNLTATAATETKTIGYLRRVLGETHPQLARFKDLFDSDEILLVTEAQSDRAADWKKANTWDPELQLERAQTIIRSEIDYKGQLERTIRNEYLTLTRVQNLLNEDVEFVKTQKDSVSADILKEYERNILQRTQQLERIKEGIAHSQKELTNLQKVAPRIFEPNFDFDAIVLENLTAYKERWENAAEVRASEPESHPALPFWQNFLAQAVVQHALKQGYAGVWVTDAMTSALTQGHVGDHDYHLKTMVGHAQNYGDPNMHIGVQTTPGSFQQALAKITGEKNTMLEKDNANRLSVGQHKGYKSSLTLGQSEQDYSLAYDERIAQDLVEAGILPEDVKEDLEQYGELFDEGLAAEVDTNLTDEMESWKYKFVKNADGTSISWFDKVKEITNKHGIEWPKSGEPLQPFEDINPITGVMGPKIDASGIFYDLSTLKKGYAEDAQKVFSNAEALNKAREMALPPKPPKPTVLRLFAQALNALFKGKADGDSVMELLIGAKDTYFTARSAGALYEGLPFLNKLLINETDYLPAEFTLRLRSADAAYGRSLEGGIVNFEIALNAGIRVADPLNPAVRTATNIREMLETKSAEGRANIYTDLHNTIVALLPTDVVYHKALMERLQQDVRIVKQLRSAKGIEVGKPEDLNARIEHYDSLLKAMESAIVKQEKAIIAQQAVLLTQSNLVQKLVASKNADKAAKALIAKPKRLKDEVIDEKDRVLHGRQYTAAETEAVSQRTGLERLEEGGGRTSFMQRAVMLSQFFAEAHPSVRKLTDSLFARQGNMYESILSRAAARVTRTGFTVKEMLQNIDRVTKSRVIREGYNDFFAWRAEQRRAGNYNPSMSHPDVVRMFRGLTPNERTTLTTQITQDINQHKYWITQARGQMGELNHLDTSHVAMVVGDMNREEATQMSEAMYTALGYARNPQTAAMGSQRLTALSEQYASPVFVAVMQHANARTASLESFMQGISRFDAYISLQRYEKHHLRMVNADGQIYRIGRDSIQELQEIRGRKEREGFSFLSLTEKPEGSDLQGGMSGPMMQLFQDMDTASLSSLEQALQGHPDAANLMERIAPLLNRTDEYRATQESFSPIPMKRDLTLGYEDIDLFKNRDEFYKRTENWFNHKLTVADTNLHLLHPEIAGNEELRTWSRQHVQNYLTPDNPLVRIINEGVYYQNLALNFGNMLLEGFQSFTTGMQTFIANTGSVGTSGELLIGANTKILNRNRTGKWSSPELAWLMQKAELQGLLEPMLFDNTVDVQTHNLMDSIATNKVKQGLNVTRGMVRKIGGFLQTYNNKVAFIAALDLLHSRGELTYSTNPLAPLNFTQLNSAFAFARGIKSQATFTGGKAQRSVELWSIKTRAVPQLMTSLTTYVQGWFSQMAKDYSKGFGAQAGRFTQAENMASRKAFMYGLAAQMVLAGGLGLPGAMQAVALAQQATGLDLKGWLKQNLAKLFNEDQDNGGFLTTFALHGAANALTPIDLSGKAAISVPLIGIDPYKGFNLASLFGANGSTVEGAAKGVMAALHGDAKGFASALPQVFRGTAQLLQGEGDIRDSRGGLQAQLTPIEQVAVALGIPLSRVQNSKDAADALSKQNKQLEKTRGELVDRLATMLRRGQNKEVQAELQGLQSLDPTLDLKSLVRTIAERVNEQTFVADPRRMANPGADLAGLQTGGLQSQELARLQQRQQSEAAMGLLPPRRRPMRAGRLTPEDQAMQMDDMMDLDPALQSSAARRQIEERRKAGRRYTPPQFDWSQSPSQ